MSTSSFAGLARLLLFALALLTPLAAPLAAQPVTQPFAFSPAPHDLPHVYHGALAWGDYDNDGDLDALMSGQAGMSLTTALYRNDGKQAGPGASNDDSSFVFVDTQAAFEALIYSRLAWGDYDNDGDLDALVMGSTTAAYPYTPVTRLYRNDSGTFTATGANLMGLHSGSAAWGDYDNDGDADLLLTGEGANDARITQLYRNNGGTFEAVDTTLPGVAYGQGIWGDYDGDGDLDVLLSGASDAGFITHVYRNDNGTFSAVATNLTRVAFASVDWGDYDGDGDLDIVVAGGQVTPFLFEGVAEIIRNDNGTFVPTTIDLTGTLAGSAAWGDYDNDGDLDILLIGAEETLGRRTARIYRNDGNDTFVSATLLVGVLFASADWGDVEGDGDLDLLAAGFASAGLSTTNLYENRRQVRPPAPDAPKTLQAEVQGANVNLHWNADTQAGLTYDLRIGTTPGGTEIVAPLADAATGQRRVFRPGLASQAAWTLRGLPNGTYYWSVQAVDPARNASTFAEEGRFTITEGVAVANEPDALVPTAFVVYPNYPNPFAASTTLRYDLPQTAHVTVRVYDLLGKTVALLADNMQPAGQHQLSWDGNGGRLAPGLYFYEVRADGQRTTGTMTLMR